MKGNEILALSHKLGRCSRLTRDALLPPLPTVPRQLASHKSNFCFLRLRLKISPLLLHCVKCHFFQCHWREAKSWLCTRAAGKRAGLGGGLPHFASPCLPRCSSPTSGDLKASTRPAASSDIKWTSKYGIWSSMAGLVL